MAGPRANWRGFLTLGQLTCGVGLFTAASTSDRVSFATVNRATGHRVARAFLDSVTGDTVEKDDQIKGYEIGPDTYLPFEEDEIAAAIPQSDKTMAIEAFIPCHQVDTVYFDKPYYLAPSDRASEEAFAVIRAGLDAASAVALARTVLFRRLRTLVIRRNPLSPEDRDRGLIATTLHYDYEVRRAAEVFDDLPARQEGGEMIELATHIIDTKRGAFHPRTYADRYEAQLAAMIRAKIDGKPLPRLAAPKEEKVVDLMAALRASAKAADAAKAKAAKTERTAKAKPAAAPRKKAG